MSVCIYVCLNSFSPGNQGTTEGQVGRQHAGRRRQGRGGGQRVKFRRLRVPHKFLTGQKIITPILVQIASRNAIIENPTWRIFNTKFLTQS